MISKTTRGHRIPEKTSKGGVAGVCGAPPPSPRSSIGVVTCLSLFLSLTAHSASPAVKNPDSENTSRSTGTHSPPGTRVLETYGNLPLSFEPNRGQTDGQVQFLSRGWGYTLFLTANQAVLSFNPPLPEPAQPATTLLMELAGANPTPQISGLDQLPGRSSYFIGKEAGKWRRNIPTYARVQYRDVYPGVDLIYYGHHQQLEYDFILAPGADPNTITLRFQGADKLEVDAEGDLVLYSRMGKVRFQKPLVYQEVDGVRRQIPGGYVLKGDQRVRFQLGGYDRERTLVIDPVLLYSTYLGGSDSDEGKGIAVDTEGNVYVTGVTKSTDFPTVNAFKTGVVDQDAFVAKLNASGSSLIYSTYLGGSDLFGNGRAEGIVIAADNPAYVAGVTWSEDFPTVNPLQTVSAGFPNTFLAKISENLVSFTLTKSGTGNGRVVSDPPGIDCGTDCSESFGRGTELTLTVTPDANSSFDGWGGDEDCGAFMVLDFDTNCTVIFTQIAPPTHFTLTVEKAGTGSGTATSLPAGIDCGSDCSEEYTNGTVVTLSAEADPGSQFTGWSGACTGTDACMVTMDEDRAVTAMFLHTDGSTGFTLTVKRTGTGSGTVTSLPEGINCPDDCSEIFPEDTEISLSQSAGQGSLFLGWDGGDDCLDGVVTMTEERVCVAKFEALANATAFLPQVANGPFEGGSIRTTFIFFNTNESKAEVTVRLTDNSGGPFQVTIPELGTGSEFKLTLDPGETRIFDTDGGGQLQSGAAVVTASAQIGVSSIFSILDLDGGFVTEAGVGRSPALTEFVFPVDSTGLFNTGVALFNPGAEDIFLEFRLLDTTGC